MDMDLASLISAAKAQGATMLALRIAVTRAQIGDRLDDIENASRSLEAALSRISEDDGCSDLIEARAVAERLRERLGAMPPRALQPC